MSTVQRSDAVNTVSRQDTRVDGRHEEERAGFLAKYHNWVVNGGRLVLLVMLMALWQALSGPVLDPLVVSSPNAVYHQLVTWAQDGTLWSNTLITLEETLLGLLCGAVAGIGLGLVIGPLQVVGRILDPFILSIYSIPKVALAPLFIVWFGIGLDMKVILAAITVFFLVFYNTVAGVRNVDPDLIDAVRLMGGKPTQIMVKVVIPSATGWILTGLRVAIPYALIGAVIGELVASNIGLGYLIDESAAVFNIAGVFAALLILTVFATVLNLFVNLLDRRMSRWKATVNLGGRRVIPQ
jgi:NitT/TauT family transport system permease protein